MSSPSSHALLRASAAQRGVGALFVANALVFATIVTRYPELKDAFGLSDLAFGLMVACGPVGSILGSVLAGRLVARAGAVPVAVTSSVVLGALLALAGFAGGPVLLGVILFAVGFADATGDVGNNAHGLEVQRRLDRSIINGLHGAWSAGAIAGGLLGLLALQSGLPIGLHFLILGVLIVAGTLVASRSLALPGAAAAQPAAGGGAGRSIGAMLVASCGIAVIGAFLEDLGSTWGGVYVTAEAGADLAASAAPFVAMMAALTLGRFASDRLVDRIGAVATVRVGSVVALAGMLLLVHAPAQPAVILGFGLVGLGIAPMIPLAMDAADRVPGLGPGTGLAVAATIMRIGFLASPLLVGAVAEAGGLRLALLCCLAVPIVSLFLAGLLRPVRPRTADLA
ncbi:MFS transporter [Agromyces seonyuensis]|uniref:MFS transporter n=1 Tax=Agromyces seonyuensis TaxID=2662446 RepID=A0A6I4P1H6_9MICO|nr:MFS transporter [Agromyces seonyuensis]MWB96964.1 MFS transporter [Agromyces seonyuensis]